MKSIIIANDGNTTNTYFYSKNVLKELNGIDNACVVLGKLTGKTYADKKAELIDKAIEFTRIDIGGLSYGEYASVNEYFETYGKRYGHLKEFKEAGII